MPAQTSVVVPVFNSNATIVELVEGISSISSSNTLGEIELILVNDGSSDNVSQIIQDQIISNNYDFDIHFIELSRNFGQKGAILAGWNIAQGEYIVTIDDDLQWSPADIPELISRFSEKIDVVYAAPTRQKGVNPFRKISSYLVDKMYQKIYSSNTPRSSFFAVRNSIARKVTRHESPFLGLPGVISWYTESIDSIQVNRYPRKFGSSGHSTPILFKEAMDIFINQSIAPLISAVWLGFIFSAIGLGLGVFYTITALINETEVPGWASIFVSISLFSSVILFILGLMSEYIGRMHISIVGKPQFSISKSVSNIDGDTFAKE